MTPSTKIINVFTLIAAVLLMVSVLLSIDSMQADWAYFKAKKALTIYSQQGENREQVYLNRANKQIKHALQIWPENPDYLVLAAQVYAWQAYHSAEPSNVTENYHKALKNLRQSIRLRPSHARTWGMLAEYKAKIGERDQEMFNAQEKALELGGADQDLVRKMMSL